MTRTSAVNRPKNSTMMTVSLNIVDVVPLVNMLTRTFDMHRSVVTLIVLRVVFRIKIRAGVPPLGNRVKTNRNNKNFVSRDVVSGISDSMVLLLIAFLSFSSRLMKFWVQAVDASSVRAIVMRVKTLSRSVMLTSARMMTPVPPLAALKLVCTRVCMVDWTPVIYCDLA